MVKKAALALSLVAFAAFVIGCASQPQGPMVDRQPTVSVSTLRSVSFSPTLAKFDARILIQNKAPVDMDFQRVDYAVDMYDTELFTEVFKGLKRTHGNGDQTVSLPFQIAMRDIASQAPDLLGEGGLRVTFRGEVYTAARYNLDPVPFTRTITIPVPRMPELTYVGTEGEPFSQAFRIKFMLKNTNPFPFTLSSVTTYLEINGKKYSLLHTVSAVDLQPEESLPVVLQMENSPGKTLSMALNLAQHPNARFNITGMVTCNTPYGTIYLPLDLEESL